MWEKEQGNLNNTRKLLERGHELNPTDAALLQVRMTDETGHILIAKHAETPSCLAFGDLTDAGTLRHET